MTGLFIILYTVVMPVVIVGMIVTTAIVMLRGLKDAII